MKPVAETSEAIRTHESLEWGTNCPQAPDRGPHECNGRCVPPQHTCLRCGAFCLCQWCNDGNPRTESSVSNRLVHTDTPVGRVNCIDEPHWPSEPAVPAPALPESEWGFYDEVRRYEAKKVTDPAADPDCRPAFRNGHNGIDFEPHKACGQIPIFALRVGYSEVEAGDWIICWRGQRDRHHWVEKNADKRLVPAPAATAEIELPPLDINPEDYARTHAILGIPDDISLDSPVACTSSALHCRERQLTQALSDLTRAQEQIAALSDSARVHSNILTGQIALTKAQAIHIAGLPADIEQQIAALQGRNNKVADDLKAMMDTPHNMSRSDMACIIGRFDLQKLITALTAPIAPEKEG